MLVLFPTHCPKHYQKENGDLLYGGRNGGITTEKKTWELVDLPSGKKLIGFKRVFEVKFKGDGSLERYKAKLVAKEYN